MFSAFLEILSSSVLEKCSMFTVNISKQNKERIISYVYLKTYNAMVSGRYVVYHLAKKLMLQVFQINLLAKNLM